MKIHKAFHKVFGFFVVVLCVAGCSSSSAPTIVYLDGYVSGTAAISDANLQITDTEGNIRAEKNAATSDYGAFMITVIGLPYEFRVVASGGKESGETVNYQLKAQYAGFKPETDRVNVNLVTTLVCAYLDRYPEKTLAEATSAVKTFLDIPTHVDIGKGLLYEISYFSPVIFMAEAQTKGGVAAFMEILVDELAGKTKEKHAFLPRGNGNLASGVPVCAGTSMAEAARNGAIAWGAGFALNIGMKELFPGMAGPTMNDINEMKQMLADISRQLHDLSNQISSAEQKIISEIVKSEYNIGTWQLMDYVTMVNNTYTDLANEIHKDPAKLTPDERTRRANTINSKLDTIKNHIEPFLGALHHKLYGTGTTVDAQGLYKVYADKLKADQRFLTKANYQDRVKKLFLYYNQIEATSLYLAVEYYHATIQTKTIVDTHTNQLGTDSKAELDWYNSVEPIPSQIVLDRDQGLMIYAGETCNGTKLCPPYMNSLQAENFMGRDMDYYNAFGYGDWWFPTVPQVNSFFKLCGSLGFDDLSQCLNSQGWPWPNKYTYIMTNKWDKDMHFYYSDQHYSVFGLEAHQWYDYDAYSTTGPWHIIPVRGGAAKAIW